MHKYNTSNVQQQPINVKQEAVKVEVKTEDDVSTDDERSSPEDVVSSSSGCDSVKSEETDDEVLGEDTNNRSNEQHLPTGDSTNDEYGSEIKATEQQQKSTQSLANYTTRPRASTVQESMNIQCITKKRKREAVDESDGSVQKAARIECSVEGCTYKAADSGTCKAKHKGYNHCSQVGCIKQAKKGGVCKRHKEFAKKKAARKLCSVAGCKRTAADSGKCSKHNGYNLCSQDGCTKQAKKGGVCKRHKEFAKVKEKSIECSVEGCTGKAADSGTCKYKHGGYNHFAKSPRSLANQTTTQHRAIQDSIDIHTKKKRR